MAVATDHPTYVIDSSVILAKLFPDEKLPIEIKKLFSHYAQNLSDFISPPLLKYEVGNAIRSARLQKRLKNDIAQKIFKNFLALPINYLEVDYQKTLSLAVKHHLSFYDASYLSLALARRVKLLTLDQKLKTAWRKEVQ